MKNNQHIKPISSLIVTRAQTNIDETIKMLGPYMLALTPAERRDLPKMGEKTLAFVEKALAFAKQNPALVPPYLEVNAFNIDFADTRRLWTLLNTIRQLEQSLDDTEMIAGSEAYQAALAFFKSVKMAAAQNVPGAKAVYEELKARFPGNRQRGSQSGETET
jgi:hypothetical protein